MYGVYRAEIEDFDLDGDVDIAAIAFFPDFYPENPENFVLLEQSGFLNFQPKTHPATYQGRWLTMDAGDIDGDGDKDLILGRGVFSGWHARQSRGKSTGNWSRKDRLCSCWTTGPSSKTYADGLSLIFHLVSGKDLFPQPEFRSRR